MVNPNSLPSSRSDASERKDACTHDNLSFEELAQAYNFLNFTSYARLLTNLILREIKKRAGTVSVLDVGCGRGIGRNVDLQREIAEAAGEFWGVEPDSSVQVPEGLFDNFSNSLLETANLPENRFDVIYSSMVMEHVARPDDFLRTVYQCLKPGGIYLFLTPNALSFVPRVTKLSHDMRVDELVLRLVQGKQQVEEYHYPVQFKINSPRLIERHASQIGFLPPEYAFIEGSGSRGYFPGPLRLVYGLLAWKRRLIRNPRRLATMICRLTRENSVPTA